jgi:hypothetical protein
MSLGKMFEVSCNENATGKVKCGRSVKFCFQVAIDGFGEPETWNLKGGRNRVQFLCTGSREPVGIN